MANNYKGHIKNQKLYFYSRKCPAQKYFLKKSAYLTIWDLLAFLLNNKQNCAGVS
tara:strand:+ start:338 stop:502 length:165 start_codon:yes stop_codon:yes gene_type:complete